MLENKCDWKISKADQNGNVYYYFPKDEDEFKEAVVKNGGMSVYVYQEGKFIDEFHTKSQGDKWTSSILNYLKTMSKDGEIFYRYYKNCKFFAIPKNTFSKDDFKIIKDNINNNISLNQILYGSPGTGKTYHTIDKALEILGENLESRDEKKAKFDEYVKNGQIVFTTFHQSYGYEEFVEGIKPHIDSEENSKEIKYEIKDGIFKELCEKALENRDSIKNFNFYIDKLKEKVKIDDNNPEKYFELPNTKYSIQYRNGKTFRIKFDDMSKNHKDYPVSIDNIEKL
ncbi:restriction endonuclease, partial [Campylobacter jejuni]|nr:restriction endonuclease [Campylobacter jejuni]